MFYPSRVTQFVINGSRGDGKDSYSLRVSFRPQPEPTPSMEKWLADSKLLDPEGPDEMFEPFSRRRGLLFHLRHRHRHHP